MLLQPTRSKRPSKQPISAPKTKLAPIHGWNARDPWAALPEGQAIVLDNWFPRASYVETRKGHMSWGTGFGDSPKTLMPYTSGTTQKLFAANNTGIYDVTTQGAIGAAALACTNGYYQNALFQNSAGWNLVAVNGQDDMALYDGTTWKNINGTSTPAITGVATSSLINVNVFKNRLFFIQANKLSFWYLPINAIAGAASEFPLQGIFSKGGSLVAMGTWSIDGGSGIDDLAVFVTSEGQVAIYKGTDPSSASAWGLVGVFNLARPVGKKCFCKYGGDLLLMLEDGLYPLSKAMQSTSIDHTVSISDQVVNAWVSDVANYSANPGWTVIAYLTAPFILVNVPIGTNGVNSYQYIMNTQTKAWTRFTGMGGVDWAVLGSNLYVCKNGEVCKAWTTAADKGANIVAYAKSGYDAFGSPGYEKQWKLIRPNLQIVNAVSILIGLAVDFRDEFLSGGVSSIPLVGGIWDTSQWDNAVWGYDYQILQSWATVAAQPGHYAATLLQISSNQQQTRWLTTDHIFETGNML